MCHNRYIEYTLMYIGYECIGYECAIIGTLIYIGYECISYVKYKEYSFMYFITQMLLLLL